VHLPITHARKSTPPALSEAEDRRRRVEGLQERTQKTSDRNLRIQELKIQPLTAAAFKPFGTLFEARQRPVSRRTLIYDKGFDVAGKTVIGVIWQPFAGQTFTQLERHFNVTQAFIPMSGSPSVVAVAAPTDPNNAEDVPRPD
jgi:Ureidoglycolate lyase